MATSQQKRQRNKQGKKWTIKEITMAIHAVFRTTKLEGDVGYGVIEVQGRKYPVSRSSPLYGDMGYGIIHVSGKTFSVYRMKKEDGDNGYGVVNIKFK
ncbi:MAG: hypothetical protein GY774_14605 [Planctomycetes bacterium]|nr:hypothetical protein [Planctomycetota bacterium]